jgi:hypothetical protein
MKKMHQDLVQILQYCSSIILSLKLSRSHDLENVSGDRAACCPVDMTITVVLLMPQSKSRIQKLLIGVGLILKGTTGILIFYLHSHVLSRCPNANPSH